MKILHLSTSLSGGAGIAALRLAEIQAHHGHDVEIISTRNYLALLNPSKKWEKSVASKASTLYNRGITHSKFDSLTPLSFSALSVREILSHSPSIVHLHNSYNLIDFPDFLDLARYVPLVATLHDERWLTGGCHITLGCTKFRGSCEGCPQGRAVKSSMKKSQLTKIEALSKKKQPLEAISPSRWMQGQVESAPWAKNRINVTVIPNVMDHLKTNRKLPRIHNKFQVLIVAATSSINKGVSNAIEALIQVAKINHQESFELLIVGGKSKGKKRILPNLDILESGSVDTSTVGELMSSADLLLVASKSENSPNVISEAQIRHLPVLATNVGGIPEIVKDMETGFLCEVSSFDIAKRILEIFLLPTSIIDEISRNAYEQASLRHDPEEILNKTLQVYLKAGAEV